MKKELEARRVQAWRGYWALGPIFKGKLESLVKSEDARVLYLPNPVVWGAQTWSTTKREAKKLLVTQNSMLRSILDIRMRDKVSSNKIRTLARSKDILYLAKKQKISYAGHIARCTGDNWSQKITNWAPYGRKRGKDRPVLRWRQEI